MQKILLVDDDALVRMFLRQIIPWEQAGYTVVGDSRDGEEALDMVAQFSPDLILSDVSMPVLDGVELVRRLREQGYPGGIIMLSCHDDFEHTKNAMQMGADEYLLKNHLNAESLLTALEQVSEKRAKKQPLDPAMEELAQKGKRLLQQETLEKLLSGTTEENEQTLLHQAGLTGQYMVCTAAVLRFPADASVQNALELCYQLAASGDMNDVEAVGVGKHGCAFLLNLTGQASTLYRQERARQLVTRIEDGMQRYVQLRPAIGVSQPCSGAHAISTALGQANQALVASFYGAGARWYGTEEAALQERLPPEAEAFAQALPELLAQPEALEAAYRQALARFPQTRTLPGVVLRWLQDCDMRAGVQRPFKVYGGLTNLTDYDGCLDAYLERARALADSRLPQGLSPQIAAAVRYLQGHFTGPVTLGDAAEAAGFHPSYFSTVFKHEMGVGFSDYLTELRLERVKEQLVQSSDAIKEIAQQAGFYDYQHFCKTFKKKVGQSPAAYRKQISKENTTT